MKNEAANAPITFEEFEMVMIHEELPHQIFKRKNARLKKAPDHIIISFHVSYQQMKSTTNAQISNFTSFLVDLRCENLPKVENGRSSFSNASYFRSVVTYKCKKPYKLRGSETRTCRATGKWDGKTTRCSKYDA